jgi:hypothetical protein
MVLAEVVGAATVGVVGAAEPGINVPTIGDALGVGTAGAALTPRLLISIDPSGIPVRTGLLVVVVDVDVGDDDDARLLKPAPHMPDNPEVSTMPEDVDNPEVAEIADDVDTEEVDAPELAMLPVVVPVAGVVAPVVTPPPS